MVERIPAANIGLEIAVKYRKGAPGVYLAKEIADAITAERETLTAAHLEDVRAAIMEADPAVLVCTLWMPDRLSPAETVVDHIDAILASKQGGEQ